MLVGLSFVEVFVHERLLRGVFDEILLEFVDSKIVRTVSIAFELVDVGVILGVSGGELVLAIDDLCVVGMLCVVGFGSLVDFGAVCVISGLVVAGVSFVLEFALGAVL